MQLDRAPAFQIQMIEPVDGFPCRLFVERRFEYSKRLI